jgi:hypothetical protein
VEKTMVQMQQEVAVVLEQLAQMELPVPLALVVQVHHQVFLDRL